jgi:cytidine deaminase
MTTATTTFYRNVLMIVDLLGPAAFVFCVCDERSAVTSIIITGMRTVCSGEVVFVCSTKDVVYPTTLTACLQRKKKEISFDQMTLTKCYALRKTSPSSL